MVHFFKFFFFTNLLIHLKKNKTFFLSSENQIFLIKEGSVTSFDQDSFLSEPLMARRLAHGFAGEERSRL